MSEMRRCDYCKEPTDSWFEVRVERVLSGMNINQFRDTLDRDLCHACAHTLLTPLGVKP